MIICYPIVLHSPQRYVAHWHSLVYFKSNMYLDTNLPAKEQHQDRNLQVHRHVWMFYFHLL
jgi:hypothetical protein